MKKLFKTLILIAILGVIPIEMFAWQGMPTPPLHVEGRYLKDPTGKNVILHGWMQPNDSYFNGSLFDNPVEFTPEDCADALYILKKQAELLTDTSSLFGYDHGWYQSFVRIGAPGNGWDNYGLVDTALFQRAWDNLYIPYIDYCRSRGLYVVLIGSVPSPEFMGTQYKENLMGYWNWIASYPGVKNVDNVMFEICNEPVDIESELGNGDWGSWKDEHDKAISDYMQDIVDTIRSTGAENIIWVPGLVWQAKLSSFAKYPVTGTNIGYAGHRYPIGANDAEEITNNFNSDWKLCSDLFPVIVTEGSWHTLAADQGLRTGSTEVFGITIKNLYDEAGNISWMTGMNGEVIWGIDEHLDPDQWTYSAINCGRAAFHWWPTYQWCAPDDGTPKLDHSSVTDFNPKQIQAFFNWSILDSTNFNGFTVKIDSQAVTIDSVVLGDTNQLVIYLEDSVLVNDYITMSYNNGNVTSVFQKNLASFEDVLVENLLEGSSPRIVELSTNENGDTLLATFNMKMENPSDISTLSMEAEYNGNINIPLLQSSFLNDDSTTLLFPLNEQTYADYKLLLSYSGNNIISKSGGELQSFSDIQVTNNSIGLPVQLDSGKIEMDGFSIIMEFSKELAFPIGGAENFTIKVNDEIVEFEEFYVLNNTIRLNLLYNVHTGDQVTVSYTPGIISASDKGALESISEFTLINRMEKIPSWIVVPGKVEAENYYLQSGIQTEQTRDVGGGLNVGWIDYNDWMEYAIENDTTETNFEIVFRVASTNDEARIDYYVDNIREGWVGLPNTGGYQTWKSIVDEITVEPGKHYFRIVAKNNGFNINYVEIRKIDETGIKNVQDNLINIYPNPVSNEMIIYSPDFQYNEIDIIDMLGNSVMRISTNYVAESRVPVNLSDGIYIVKLYNGKKYQLRRIIIDNK